MDGGCSGVGMVVGMVVGEVDRGSTTRQSEEGTMVQAGASNGDSVWACVARWRSVRSRYGVVDACVAVLGVSVSNYPVGPVGSVCQEAIRLDQTDADAFYYRGIAHARQGDEEQAVDDLTRFRDLATTPELYQRASEALQRLERW